MVASGFLQISEIASYKLPPNIINYCLLILGSSVGCRFAEKTIKDIAKNALHSFIATFLLVILGLIAAFIAGLVISTLFFTITGFAQAKDENLNNMIEEIDTYVQDQLNNKGRFQLQSFQIARTHWHYMLDTATGKLYRLEPSRSPGNSKWILTADSNF